METRPALQPNAESQSWPKKEMAGEGITLILMGTFPSPSRLNLSNFFIPSQLYGDHGHAPETAARTRPLLRADEKRR